jgi:uncharacterized protein YbjT (DUF2867 family)
MTVLISGASGRVGRLVVEEVLGRGETVRALTRDAGAVGLPAEVEVVEGDVTDPASLRPEFFEGVDALFVFPADGVAALVDSAVTAGVKRFVVLSSLAVSAEFPRDVGSASYRHHLAVEEAVTSLNDDWTMLRPGSFANNLLAWSHPVRAGQAVRAPYVHSAQALIHEADIAAVAAVTLTEPGHQGQIYPLTGPESLTKIDQLAAISSAIGRTVVLDEITPEQFRVDVGRFMPDDLITMLLDYWHDTDQTPEVPKTTVAEILGRPARTLLEWANDHRAAFLAPAEPA